MLYSPGSLSTQSERVTLRIPTPGKMISRHVFSLHQWLQYKDRQLLMCFMHFFDPDNESDTEVPYADIMIAARGVSTPELTQVCYLTPGDQKEVRDKT